ncbi:MULTISPECIES: Rid family detoxifying hydrolase [Malaciobacter]|jgi:2-iminobutanoate/2-iminopropanoate deaminase|uniref:2-iminobutanoate/2-iminopropanoate deaminase n=2 Tax=Malaciobacter TaxID=2321114 RepID=A0AB36ZW53_9BACT|nr:MULTISPECIES: Rid family detoxifying hydrolase [Malaciobacter]PHO09422.1 deaminase [Malaciobacter canalis]PPK60858.1 2-iminobutanoate/2-iminopropanoate deaminase [Malaciobacter marinus]QEE33545.1 reactive intermediate/imine deaminase [Malaciobacter canalis]SKB63026.1 endoribonuclease L-PSP [Malaciobacter marinus]
MEFLHTNRVPAAIGPYSQAIKANGLIYTSGQIPLKANGELVENDIKKQTRQVLENIRMLLEDCQSSMDKVIKVSIYLENMEDFGIVNVLYAEAFGEHKPVRSTIAVKTLPKNVLIEMDVIALPYDYQ